MKEVKTNPESWDCECENYYIHTRTKYPETNACRICGSVEEDQPDSRVGETSWARPNQTRKLNLWSKKFEEDFEDLLTKHFDERTKFFEDFHWNYSWTGKEDGFSLNLEVWSESPNSSEFDKSENKF